jgi:hypothetical protein
MSSSSADSTRESGRPPDQGGPETMTFILLAILVAQWPKLSYEIVCRYICGIPFRRRLSREFGKLFTAKILTLLDSLANSQPQFIQELALDLVRRIPKARSRCRGILAELINSVLEDLGIFHSRRDVFLGLPDEWDVALPENETPERRMDVEEEVRVYQKAMELIDPRSAWMLCENHFKKRSLEDIGHEVGLGKTRVGEIIAAAKAALVKAIYKIREDERTSGPRPGN